jgi:hypothetical protein
MNGVRRNSSRILRWRAWIASPWVWALLAMSIVMVAEAMDVRVGGGHSYGGSGRSSGSGSSGGARFSVGGGGGHSGDSSVMAELLIRLFLLLPWPMRIVLLILIIVVIVRASNSGSQVSYSSLQTGSPTGFTGAFLASPRLPPSISSRAQRIDPAFSEVLFLERAVMLVNRLFEASSSQRDLERLAPYATTEVVAELLKRTGGAQVRGVIIGQITPISVETEASPGATADAPALLVIQVRLRLNRHVQGADGDSTWYSHEEWSFARAVGSPPVDEDKIDRFGCQGCGSPVERDALGRCAHCGMSLLPGASDWCVRSAWVIEEESRGPLLTTDAPEVGTGGRTAKDSEVEVVAARLLPGPQRGAFEDRARSIFTNLQHAWSKRDLNLMRPFETNALWQAHRFWVEEYLRQGLRNVVDDVKISKLELCRVQRDGEHISVTCRIHASVIDRTINERTLKVVSGHPSRPRQFTEYWTFVKHADAPGSTDMTQCPSCGASMSVTQAGACEYCQTKVTLGQFDWVASRIEQDEEIVPE